MMLDVDAWDGRWVILELSYRLYQIGFHSGTMVERLCGVHVRVRSLSILASEGCMKDFVPLMSSSILQES